MLRALSHLPSQDPAHNNPPPILASLLNFFPLPSLLNPNLIKLTLLPNFPSGVLGLSTSVVEGGFDPKAVPG
jgi:hypothetical protein